MMTCTHNIGTTFVARPKCQADLVSTGMVHVQPVTKQTPAGITIVCPWGGDHARGCPPVSHLLVDSAMAVVDLHTAYLAGQTTLGLHLHFRVSRTTLATADAVRFAVEIMHRNVVFGGTATTAGRVRLRRWVR